MSKLTITIFLTLAILSTVSAKRARTPAPVAAPAQAPSSGDVPAFAPGPAVDECLTPLLNMSDCLGYVSEGSNLTVPDKNCCPELAGLIDSNVICLCKMLGGNIAQQFGLSIDMGRALKLPSVCKIDTPSVTLCSAVGYPVEAPATSPSSDSTPTTPTEGDAPTALTPSASTEGKEKGAASSIAGSALAIFGGLAFSFLLSLF